MCPAWHAGLSTNDYTDRQTLLVAEWTAASWSAVNVALLSKMEKPMTKLQRRHVESRPIRTAG
jgi:hypothetical protein